MEPRLRASAEQFSILLDFMERHGDLSKPQQGPQGRILRDRLWAELGNLLNSVSGGVQKSSEKWKKVWADWKTKTKKKYLTCRRHASHTGGGPSSGMSLTALEERVVAVIGVSAVVGQAAIEEHGFNRTPNEPVLENATIEPSLGHSSASIIQYYNHINTTSTPESSSVPRASQATSTLPPPSQPPQTPPPVPQTPPPPPTIQPPPSSSLRTPPPHSNRQQVADSPRSATTTPRRALLRARRNRGSTPFERVAHEFAAVEQRRLAREESREMRRLDYEEARDRRLHEGEMEGLRLEAQRIEVAQQTNELLHQLGVLAQCLIDVISQQGSLPSTDPI
ncbi:hypothetical protein ACJJTC_005429 [Scirpophaga incertulas]